MAKSRKRKSAPLVSRAAPGQLSLDQAMARAQAHMQAGRLKEAGALIDKVLAAAPHNSAAHSALGQIYHQLGRYADAERHLQLALKTDPRNASLHLNMGNVLASMGKSGIAETHYRAALAADPGLIGAHRNLSRILLSMGRAEDAVAHAKKAVDLAPDDAVGYTRLGNALDRLGRLDDAIAAHEKAVALAPDLPQVRLRYAESLSGYGKMDEARAQCRKVLETNPANAQAWAVLTSLTKYKTRNNDIGAMEALAADPELGVHDRTSIEHSLGKALEDIGDYPAAFKHFSAGNGLVRKRLNYSPRHTELFFADIKAAFTKDLYAAHRDEGDKDATPIFVLGMPRSGTSLVEQILSSHPKVAGAGELSLAAGLARTACEDTKTTALSAAMKVIGAREIEKLGQLYVRQLRAYAPDAEHIIDKLPGNFLYIGLIHLVLPNARIVHCRRNPLDTCLSIYKTHFTEGALAYSYDMEELGHYYRLYTDLMAHWHKVLPGTVYDISYEALVADQETQSRKLLAYCGLDWTDDVLSFHKTSRPVHTASVAQVRQPIYKGSVGAAARYGDALDPLIGALGPGLAGA